VSGHGRRSNGATSIPGKMASTGVWQQPLGQAGMVLSLDTELERQGLGGRRRLVKKWTPEEDDRLVKLVYKLGVR
jgi:hypothetical protein